MVAVFAVFATLSMLMFKQFGVGLAAAILIDATIVRGVLLPASMKLLGDWNWYVPSWLEWLPSLRRRRRGAARGRVRAARRLDRRSNPRVVRGPGACLPRAGAPCGSARGLPRATPPRRPRPRRTRPSARACSFGSSMSSPAASLRRVATKAITTSGTTTTAMMIHGITRGSSCAEHTHQLCRSKSCVM